MLSLTTMIWPAVALDTSTLSMVTKGKVKRPPTNGTLHRNRNEWSAKGPRNRNEWLATERCTGTGMNGQQRNSAPEPERMVGNGTLQRNRSECRQRNPTPEPESIVSSGPCTATGMKGQQRNRNEQSADTLDCSSFG